MTICDRSEMQQVLTNLITNAIHASQPGGQIEVATRMEKRQLPVGQGTEHPCAVVRVTDHGSGVPHEVLPRIFDPFFTTKDLGSGTGLGLSVAYGIVSDHHGWISVDTRLGEGTGVPVFVPQ